MAEYLISGETLTEIAQAIRDKTETTDALTPLEFPAAIYNIFDYPEEWIGDGNTHIWISLAKGRTSPMLGVGVNGTISVDWGDGTEPDTLTGTSTDAAIYTPKHEYAEEGDYVITLSGTGKIGFVNSVTGSASLLLVDNQPKTNAYQAYRNGIKKVEIGKNVTTIGDYAFNTCAALTSVLISNTVTSIGVNAFRICYSLASVIIPDGVTSIGDYAFFGCYGLRSIVIPGSVTSIGKYAFNSCYSLDGIVVPEGVTGINEYTFGTCNSLASVIIPASVRSIANNAFLNATSASYYDFTAATAVPTLGGTNAFKGIPSDCQIRVPAALVDKWKAATNWPTYASNIVGV